MGEHPVKLPHSAAVHIQDDPGVTDLVVGHGVSHVDHVGVHQDQTAGPDKIGAVIKEEDALTLLQIVDLVFIVKMIGAHVISVGASEMLQGDPVHFGIIKNGIHIPLPSCQYSTST